MLRLINGELNTKLLVVPDYIVKLFYIFEILVNKFPNFLSITFKRLLISGSQQSIRASFIIFKKLYDILYNYGTVLYTPAPSVKKT